MEIRKELLLSSTTFWVVTALFATANAWSWLRHKTTPVCCDQEITVGFPFPFHIAGGIAGLSNFYPIALLLDLSVYATIALTATWIARLLSPR
jgi:hypothetical protein